AAGRLPRGLRPRRSADLRDARLASAEPPFVPRARRAMAPALRGRQRGRALRARPRAPALDRGGVEGHAARAGHLLRVPGRRPRRAPARGRGAARVRGRPRDRLLRLPHRQGRARARLRRGAARRRDPRRQRTAGRRAPGGGGDGPPGRRSDPPRPARCMSAGSGVLLTDLYQLTMLLAWVGREGRFYPAFVDYLARLRFAGDVHALPEGTVFFADEPTLRVTAPLPEAQLVESRLLNLLHFQTLVASKAARAVLAAPGKLLVDFGMRRAHGAEAALLA